GRQRAGGGRGRDRPPARGGGVAGARGPGPAGGAGGADGGPVHRGVSGGPGGGGAGPADRRARSGRPTGGGDGALASLSRGWLLGRVPLWFPFSQGAPMGAQAPGGRPGGERAFQQGSPAEVAGFTGLPCWGRRG